MTQRPRIPSGQIPGVRIPMPRIHTAIALLYVALTLVAAVLGYRWGYARWFSGDLSQSTQSPEQSPESAAALLKRLPFQVQGRSMSPTLVDGQVCWIEPLETPLRIGDVVAVEWDSVRHVKRVAAVAGDTVDVGDTVDSSARRLIINGKRLEDLLAEQQSLSNQSPKFLPPGLVTLPSESVVWEPHPDQPNWQMMRYRNPHQNGRITQVVDDYPENVDVKRRLNPVDRLVVQIAIDGHSSTDTAGKDDDGQMDSFTEFAVAFHLNQTTVIARTENGLARASDAVRHKVISKATATPSIKLSATSPLAIKLSRAELARHSIQVHRQIEYRDDHRTLQVDYPITLNQDELFLVGDNVPVSVDSRSIGPVSVESVIGRVVVLHQEHL